jgi:hypothetical protein
VGLGLIDLDITLHGMDQSLISTSTSFSSKSNGLNVDIYLWADGC